MRMNHFQAEVFALHLPHHLAPLLAVHLIPMAARRRFGCFLDFPLWLGFHANLSTLNSTWPGPVDETHSVSPSGSAVLLFRTTPPPSTQSPIPEPCLVSGRNAPKKLRP